MRAQSMYIGGCLFVQGRPDTLSCKLLRLHFAVGVLLPGTLRNA